MTGNKYYEILDYLMVVINGSEFEGHVFAVGGCERDKKLGNNIKDIDLVIDLPNGGIRFAEWLHDKGLTMWAPVVYQHFGTAMFTLKQFPNEELEAVQTRKECYHDMESRNPDTAFGTLQDDCTRRDFTVNAFYRNISTFESLDINGKSQEDLDNKLIRTCGDPEIIFSEDPLRVLRMVRFAARLEFTIEEKTFECAKKCVDRLSIISRERINDEFFKMCSVEHFYQFKTAMCLLWDLGAFKFILPYLGKIGTEKRFNLLWKIDTIWGHNLSPKLIEHYNHRLLAAMLYECPDAEEEMRKLRCPNDFVSEVMFFISQAKELEKDFDEEMYEENEKYMFRKYANRAKDINRLKSVFMVGDPVVYDYFFDMDDDWDYGPTCIFDNLLKEENKYLTYKLPVDGEDVMCVANIQPGPKVKEYLDRLLKFAFANPDNCEREDILNYLRYIVKENE